MMNAIKKIYWNTMFLGIAEIISRVLQFAIMLYAAHGLSQMAFGKFNFALSLSLIATVLADLGINTLLIREIARERKSAGKYFGNALTLKLGLCLLTFFVVFIVLFGFKFDGEATRVVVIVWLFTILSTFTELFYSIFRAFEKMHFDAIVKISRMILLAFSTIAILSMGFGVVAFSLMFVLVEFCVLIFSSILAQKYVVQLSISYDPIFIRGVIRKALPFGLSVVFGTLYFFIGSVILYIYKGDVEVAIFSAAYNLAIALLFIPTVYTNAIYPVLSRYFNESKEKLTVLFYRSLKYMVMIGLPITVGCFLLADEVISLLYKDEYAASGMVLRIIALYLFLKFINFLFGVFLSSINEQAARMKGQGLTALFNIIVGILLIPILGFIGAAVATLVTEIFLVMLYYWYVSRKWKPLNLFKLMIKPALAALGMAALILFTPFNAIVTIVLGAITYAALIWLIGGFDREDKRMLRKILQ